MRPGHHLLVHYVGNHVYPVSVRIDYGRQPLFSEV